MLDVDNVVLSAIAVIASESGDSQNIYAETETDPSRHCVRVTSKSTLMRKISVQWCQITQTDACRCCDPVQTRCPDV